MCLQLFLWAACSALTPPNTSLSTIPVAYFGGHKSPRGSGGRSPANLAMLSKMRIVMLEKWEGHCYDECFPFKNGSINPHCNPSCNVENEMLGTMTKVKALNPSVTTVFYLNTLLLFPFYSLAGKYQQQNALLIDSQTHLPVLLRNDESMPNIFVPDFGTKTGRALLLDTVEQMIKSGTVDGIFADKWPNGANRLKNGSYLICNHACGHLTQAKGDAWNAGKLAVRNALLAMLRVNATNSSAPAPFGGLLYGDGCNGCDRRPWMDGNLIGPWHGFYKGSKWPAVAVWSLLERVHAWLHIYDYSYIWLGCSDHMNKPPRKGQPPDPDDLSTDCAPEALPLFLLVVEPGVFLGANGWDPAFDRPLGHPHGPAQNITDGQTVVGLTRSFTGGARVVWNLTNASGTVQWPS